MWNKFIVCILFWFSLSASFLLASQETSQRYVGTLSNQITKMQQLVKLDLIPIPKNEHLTYTGFLTFYLGDFDSKEYVTYHFDEVLFDPQTSTITFDQEDQAVSLFITNGNEDTLHGELKSSLVGKVGDVDLYKSPSSKPKMHLSPKLAGEYKGICSGVETTLQIQTMRSTEDTVRIGNPFGAYLIKAQWGEPITNDGCYGVKAPCVKYTYQNGTYNFFSGELALFGKVKNRKCMVSDSAISCEKCILKSTDRIQLKAEYTYPSSKPFWHKSKIEELEQTNDLHGHYEGFLHHEYLNLYQNISLEINNFPKLEDRNHNRIISAVAKVYFGDCDSSESIFYRFRQARFNLVQKTIFLSNVERDTDAFLALEIVSKDVMKGSWFSILFGKVGTFLLSKDKSLEAIPEGKKMGKLSGSYQSSKWKFNLTISRESTPLNTQNPFFPLNFKGFTHLQNILDFNPIDSGSYDFYTGKIAILLKDGSAFFGDRKDQWTLRLKRPSPGVLRPLLENALVDYKREEVWELKK